MTVVSLSDAKWSCSSCGDCCKGFSFGPVEEHVVSGLMAAKIEDIWHPSRQGWVEKSVDGEWFFKQVSGHCVFLREDNLCAIHDLLGESAKPWFCREYPFHLVREPRGVAVRVREDCGGYYKSFSSGHTVQDSAQALLSLPRIVPVQSILDRTIIIGPGLGVSAENWVEVEPLLLQRVKDAPDIHRAVNSIRSAIDQMTGRDSKISTPFRQIYLEILTGVKARIESQSNLPNRFRTAREDMLLFLSRASREPEGRYTPEAHDFWSVVLRGRILGKRFAAFGGLPSGIGLSLFEFHLLSGKSSPMTLEGLGPSLSQWRRALMAPPFWELLRSYQNQFSALYFCA